MPPQPRISRISNCGKSSASASVDGSGSWGWEGGGADPCGVSADDSEGGSNNSVVPSPAGVAAVGGASASTGFPQRQQGPRGEGPACSKSAPHQGQQPETVMSETL